MNDDDDRMSVSTQDTNFDDDMTIDSGGNNPYVEDEPFDMTVSSPNPYIFLRYCNHLHVFLKIAGKSFKSTNIDI